MIVDLFELENEEENYQKSINGINRLMKAINFVPSGDTHKQCLMHSKSDKIEIMINDKTDKVIEELFNHFVLVIILGWKHQ